VFYTAPTAIRSLIRLRKPHPPAWPRKYDLSSLRILGSVGEPINPSRLDVVSREHRRQPLPHRGHLVADRNRRPHDHAAARRARRKPGSASLPFFGVEPVILRDDGTPVPNEGGKLCIKKPWPGMMRTIWGDHDRFIEDLLPECSRTSTSPATAAAHLTRTATYWLMGRIDDVVNVSGHRIGTMEIESALVSHTELVAEAAVVGRPDDLTGEAICAFVVLKRSRPTGDEAKQIATELRNWVAKEIGPIAKPKEIRFGDNLPKTRSGKIMRRLLRSLAKGEAVTQDIDAENPAILEQFDSKRLARRGPSGC
jgi:acetyl-CoA synthetase